MTREEIIRDLSERSAGAGADQYMTLRCDVAREIVRMLREQDEGIEPIKSTTEQKKFADRIGFAVSEFWCGACHFNLIGRPKFCPNCGKAVKWDGERL